MPHNSPIALQNSFSVSVGVANTLAFAGIAGCAAAAVAAPGPPAAAAVAAALQLE
jgi:hypothetical protein